MSIRIDPVKSLRIVEKGMRAGSDLDCCSCKGADCTILTTSMVVGGIIGTGLNPGIGTGVGIGAGFLVGMAIIAVKNSKKKHKAIIS